MLYYIALYRIALYLIFTAEGGAADEQGLVDRQRVGHRPPHHRPELRVRKCVRGIGRVKE